MNGRPQAVRVTPGNKLYPSYAAAFADLGISALSSHTYRRVREGYPIKGYYIDPIEPDDPDWFRCPSRKTKPQFRRGRPVRCVETGKVWPSAAAAARAHFVVPNCVYHSIHKGYAAGGYHWVWAEEDSADAA